MASPAIRAVTPEAAPLTSEEITTRIQAYVDRGDYPLLAAEKVTQELCREGRQDELLVLFYPPPLFDLWQTTKPASSEPRAVHKRLQHAALKAKGSLLESLVEVNGQWKRLGSATRADCLKAASGQKRKALAIAQRARFYHAIAQTLNDTQTVRDALTDDALAQMFQDAGR